MNCVKTFQRRCKRLERPGPLRDQVLHPGRLTAGTCPHGGLVQIIFLSKWVMAVGSMLIFQGVSSLKDDIAPENRSKPKREGSSSNHPFSGASC